MRKVLAMLLALAMAALVGCGRAAEKAAEKVVEETTGISVDEDGNTVTVKGEDGEAVFTLDETGSEVPEGFPLPVYPGAKVTGSSKMTSNDEALYTVELSYKGAAAPVADFYENALREMGATGDNLFRLNANDGNLDSVTISATTPDGHSYVLIQTDKETNEGNATLTWATPPPED